MQCKNNCLKASIRKANLHTRSEYVVSYWYSEKSKQSDQK